MPEKAEQQYEMIDRLWLSVEELVNRFLFNEKNAYLTEPMSTSSSYII